MPIIKLTRRPDFITPDYALVNLWEMQILAHSFYPEQNSEESRAKWVERIQRTFAKDWTSRFCVFQDSGDLYKHWYAMHGLSLTPDRIRDLKSNEDRDLKIAARLLIDCTLGGLSKAKAINRFATKLVAEKGANSLHGAEMTVKRAWRKYFPACHYMAAWSLTQAAEVEKTQGALEFRAFTTISLAETLRKMAETKIPTHGSTPILDAKRTWKVPDWFPLSTISAIDWNDGKGAFKSEMVIATLTTEES